MQRHFLLLTASSFVACGAGSALSPKGNAPAVSASSPAASANASARARANANAQASLGELAAPTAELEERLRRHFAQYHGGSNFAFFEQDFAPRVERYLGLKDVAATQLARIAKEFYATKTQVSLVPKPGSLTVTNEGGRLAASLVLTMRWSVEPPAAAASCGFLDDSMTWRPHSRIARRVEVTARIGIDAAARFVTYEELPGALPRLRVASRSDGVQAFSSLPTGPVRLVDAGPASVLVPDGTVVEDLGETFTCGLDQTEVDTVRKVKLNGRAVWMLADWTYDTGHSFVGDTPLVPDR